MNYYISFDNPLTHIINISLKIGQVMGDTLFLQLPAWRPGRYEIANFAQNILQIEAKDSIGNQLSIKKNSKDQWKIQVLDDHNLTINYSYYAHKMDAGNSWLDEDQLYLNFINCMLYVTDRMNESCKVHLHLPENYRIASGLIEKKHHLLLAESYYQLVDSPLMSSDQLEHYSYTVQNVCFSIWIQGTHQLDINKMLHDFEKFTRIQLDVMEDFPSSTYHFLIQALPYKHYHGVEHQNSTVITLGPADQLNNSNLYQALLGISSHELFHAWNIIKIRPEELLPYDFSKENYFDTGYVAEGVTTYYGDLFLVRSGVLSVDWYFNKVNKILKNHFENFGRMNMSVADASFDLWLDGYKAGTPNRKVSIYNEGAIIALLIDLQIRLISDHEKSLDNIMRTLWKVYGKTNTGYTSNSLMEILQNSAIHDWQKFYNEYIYGTAPIQNLLSSLLDSVGCELRKTSAEEKHESIYGFRVDSNNYITKIQPKSPAEELLSVGDHIKNMDVIIPNNVNTITLDIERNCKQIFVEISATDPQYFEYYQVHQVDNPSISQQIFFKKWIG